MAPCEKFSGTHLPRTNKFQQFVVCVAGRAYGSYNLGAVKGVFEAGGFVHLAVAVFLNIVFHNNQNPVREFLPLFLKLALKAL
jgi:hypothetical protein